MESPKEGNYLCLMENGYIKMCYFTGKRWLDMWEKTLKGKIKNWIEIPAEIYYK